jgi:glycosyltransferase involved in cell wall biosynthesis
VIKAVRMLIVHVVPTPFGLTGLHGGGERYPLELCRALTRHVSCRLVTFGSRVRRVRDDGLEIVELATVARLKGHPVHPLARGLIPALRGADVIHTHQTRSAPSRIAAVVARATRTPVVTTDHGLGGGGWGGLLPRLFDRFLTVSQNSADVLGAPALKTRIVYGGVDAARFRPGPEDRRGVLFVGRITPHKGIDRLLRAAPEGVPVTIAGSGGHDRAGPERSYPQLLRELASDDVTFPGAVPEEELPALYRRAEVFVLPSVSRTVYGVDVAISELLGLSVLEAMASETPVIASRIGGLAEVVVHGATGYLVTPGDVDELRARIADLLGDPRRARAMGRAGRALVLERFTWEQCARRCLQAYEELPE